MAEDPENNDGSNPEGKVKRVARKKVHTSPGTEETLAYEGMAGGQFGKGMSRDQRRKIRWRVGVGKWKKKHLGSPS